MLAFFFKPNFNSVQLLDIWWVIYRADATLKFFQNNCWFASKVFFDWLILNFSLLSVSLYVTFLKLITAILLRSM